MSNLGMHCLSSHAQRGWQDTKWNEPQGIQTRQIRFGGAEAMVFACQMVWGNRICFGAFSPRIIYPIFCWCHTYHWTKSPITIVLDCLLLLSGDGTPFTHDIIRRLHRFLWMKLRVGSWLGLCLTPSSNLIPFIMWSEWVPVQRTDDNNTW